MHLHLSRIISGAPLDNTIIFSSSYLYSQVIILRLLSNGISSIFSYLLKSIFSSLKNFKIAPSVGFPITPPSVIMALLHKVPINAVFSRLKIWESVTVILFSVNVPVLSLHITVHDPRVSTESNRLTIALDLDICCIPRARVNVRTAGRPSGIAATASETAVMNVSTIGIPFVNSRIKTAIQTIIEISDNVFPSLDTLILRGVSPSSSWTISAISPIAVFIPMLVTTPIPCPERIFESI